MGQVYIINAIGTSMYKIGFSDSVETRLRSLQTGSPSRLRLVHTMQHNNEREIERLLHTIFAKKRSHNEWFSLSDDELFQAKKIIGFPPPPEKERISVTTEQRRKIFAIVSKEYNLRDLILDVWGVDIQGLDYKQFNETRRGYAKCITSVLRKGG